MLVTGQTSEPPSDPKNRHTRVHSLSDINEYWMLTSLGTGVLHQIRREALELGEEQPGNEPDSELQG
jgi:hypothetical protein